jgi:hypothetical protein
VNVRAAGNGLDGPSDRPTIFEHRFVFGQIAKRNLMTEGHIIDEFDFSGGFAFEGDRTDDASLFQIGDGDSDVISGFVQQNSMLHIWR